MSEYVVYRTKYLFTGLDDDAHPGSFSVENGRFSAVGSYEDADALSGRAGGRIVDLGDAFVCAGFHDSHLHFFHSALYSSPLALHCRGRNEQDCVDALAPLANRRPETGWLLAQGWRQPHWDPPTTPSKRSLDAVYPDRPVAMYSGDAHTLWLNSLAIEELGLSDESVAPEGGSYDRDDEGRLTGIVREAAAMALMPRIVASFLTEELLDAYRGFLKKLAENGVTSVCDMSLMAAPGLDFVRDDLFAELLAREELTCRVHLFPTLLDDRSRLHDLQRNLVGNRLRACGFKQFFDGVSSQHTAWVNEPYANARFEGDCGRPTVDPSVMRDLVLAACAEGQPVRVHAIGDEAIHVILDIFEEGLNTFGPLPEGRHHCIEHLENFQPDDIARLAKLGVVAAVQPMHITLDPGAPEKDLGPQRVPYMWPFAALLESGATLAFGTDSPVADIDPRAGLYTAITRKTIPDGNPPEGWVPQEKIGAADALRAYTLGSARAAGREHDLGTIEAGKLADFVVIDRDLSSCDPELILDARIEATYVEGACVYSRS
ncbi:amidohydrolase [Gordonibacter sp. Marseille-P4307]|uniref:amidohydrolase n=1 Tax=Gordonibacter sp. Marseille-P4307 TaxID=2161815 RepID=UPI000F52C6C8|nr:amidohydrolase [Gordonibacter sp. Marseille-P4307]